MSNKMFKAIETKSIFDPKDLFMGRLGISLVPKLLKFYELFHSRTKWRTKYVFEVEKIVLDTKLIPSLPINRSLGSNILLGSIALNNVLLIFYVINID